MTDYIIRHNNCECLENLSCQGNGMANWTKTNKIFDISSFFKTACIAPLIRPLIHIHFLTYPLPKEKPVSKLTYTWHPVSHST